MSARAWMNARGCYTGGKTCRIILALGLEALPLFTKGPQNPRFVAGSGRGFDASTFYSIQARSNEMSWAPSQSTSSPSSRRCSRPSTIVRKWLPANCPTMLANLVPP